MSTRRGAISTVCRVLGMLQLLRIRLRSLGRVRVSRSVRVARGARVEAARGARVVLFPGVTLGPDSRISAVGGSVVVGPGARLGERSIVVSHAGVTIGARAVVGDWAAVSDAAPGFADAERPVRVQTVSAAPLVVGDGAVIGLHAAVDASVAAGAVVAPYAASARHA